MKAAVLVKTGEPLELADLVLPRLGVGQCLVRIKFSGICGAQLGEISGAKGEDKFLPHCLGHEAVGEVVEVGAGVKTKSVGDRVVLHWRPGLGIQSDPPVYSWNGRRVHAGWVTTFQEQAVVSENRLTKLPVGVDEHVAPLLGCSITTALGVIENDAKVRPGESVLIFGAGGVGLAIVQTARLVSAHPIHIVDPVMSKLVTAIKFGADGVQEANRLYDTVVDTTGKSSVIESAYRLTKPAGRTILVGVPRHDDPITIHTLPLHFGKILSGSHGGDCKPHQDIPRLGELMRAGLLNLEGLVTDEYPLEQVNAAIDHVRSGEAGRVLLRMS